MFVVALGLILLIFLVSRKLNVVVAAPLAIIFIAIGNRLNPLTMVTGPYVEGMAYFIEQFLLITLLGVIFGKVMEHSRAANAIGSALVRLLGPKRATTAIFLAAFILGVGGIAGFVLIFTLYPLGMAVFEQANLPKRLLVPCIGSGIVMAITAPATPQIQNLIPIEFLGTLPTAGFWPGVISVVVASAIIIVYLEKQASRARQREEGFTPSQVDGITLPNNLPALWLSILPLITIVSLLSVFGLHPLVALGSGILLAFVLLYKYVPSVLEALNEGAKASMMPLLFSASSVGFGLALKSVPDFIEFIGLLARSSWNPYIMAAIITNLAAGIMGSASGGIVLTLTTVGDQLSIGANPALLHRVVTLSAGGLDSLPHNAAYLTMLAVSGLTLRETYKDHFITTVVSPIIGVTVVLLLYSIGLFQS